MQQNAALRNVGIFAHVDAGKTTLTEQMLYESGAIRRLGRVDQGTAHTDYLDIERERGISVRMATTVMRWDDKTINLVDTPGHVDFSSEVERALRVMDGAVLVISAVEGVQAHTESIWHALKERGLPTLIYVNKLDRTGADPERVLSEIRRMLTPDAVPVQAFSGTEHNFTAVSGWGVQRAEEAGQWGEVREGLLEKVAEKDEAVLERYIGGQPLEDGALWSAFIALVHEAELVPVYYGSAMKGIGVRELMDAIAGVLPGPTGQSDHPVSGVVFKIERNKSMGRIAYVRLYEGTVSNRDSVVNTTLKLEEKITQIRKMHAQSYEDVGQLAAGDIAAVCGLSSARIGDVLGNPDAVPPVAALSVPMLTVQVSPIRDADYTALAAALQELTDEDPLLDLQWLQDERELHLKMMGSIQIEVLASLLQSRFNLEARFGQPSVIYKETPAEAGVGFVSYTMPKPCWAVLRFAIEPGKRGSGLQYRSIVRAEDLLPSYQNEVERRVPQALRQGLHGWEVTDLKITLIEGEHHVWHTHPLDFVVATPMGIMDGLARTGTKLLEPMQLFRISLPEEYGGKVLAELVQMRAEFESPVVSGGRFAVEGIVPVATSLNYPVKLASMTGGRGVMATRFGGYRECPLELGAERPYRGVNPLDRSKYILSARSALS